MAIGYTVNHIEGTHSIHFRRATRDVETVCQKIIAEIGAIEAQKLAALPGVSYASFETTVVDPPDGVTVAEGWLENIEIVTLHFERDPLGPPLGSGAIEDVSVSYKGIVVIAQEGIGEPTKPERKGNGYELLRERFRRHFDI